MDLLTTYLSKYISLNQSDLELVKKKCAPITLEKGAVILREGKVAKNLYFIEKGLLCGKLNKDGKENFNWFASENQFVTSLHSFLSQKPSYEHIEALEKCQLYEIAYDNLQLLYEEIPAFEKLGRILIEEYYVLLEERTLSLQYHSAREKYRAFLENEPGLYHRISLGQLASYLGISQETLSRIRAKKNKQTIF